MTPRRHQRSASADDLLTTLGLLTAQARAGAELQHARVELASALQREMLPASLPALPGLRTAARYAPARDGLDIGGDWYDGFPLPDGTVAFSIGDVQGHDVEAAAFMGQVRIGLRAVAAAAPDPGEVLSRANDLLLSMDRELFATCSFLRFDPATWELESARAYHVPAVWATADGEYGITLDDGGLPLGMLTGSGYPVTRRRLRRRRAPWSCSPTAWSRARRSRSRWDWSGCCGWSGTRRAPTPTSSPPRSCGSRTPPGTATTPPFWS